MIINRLIVDQQFLTILTDFSLSISQLIIVNPTRSYFCVIFKFTIYQYANRSWPILSVSLLMGINFANGSYWYSYWPYDQRSIVAHYWCHECANLLSFISCLGFSEQRSLAIIVKCSELGLNQFGDSAEQLIGLCLIY